jgi:hypothetical protein
MPPENWLLERKRMIENYARGNPGFADQLRGLQEQQMLAWIMSMMGMGNDPSGGRPERREAWSESNMPRSR